MGRKLILKRSRSFLSSTPLVKCRVYSVLPAISSSYPHLKGRLPTCSSPVRHSRREASFSLAVRLACLRRAASVRSEPGSNSPLFYFKHPEGRLIFIILKASPVSFILGTLTFKRKKATMQSNYLSPYTLFLLILCSTLISLPKILLFGFFFFPFPLISKTSLLNRNSALERRKRKRMYHKTVCFVKHLFLFYLFFFTQFSKRYKLKKHLSVTVHKAYQH